MKRFTGVFLISLFLVECSHSQVQVSIASSGIVIGTYDPGTDAISLDNNATSNYIAQKYSGQNVNSFSSEKEGDFAYLIVETTYVVNDTTYQKITAETLSPSTATDQFTIPTDCVENSCDGGCGGNIIENCSHCQFDKKNGEIIGCKCRQTGFCCHSIKTVPCNQ